MNKQIKAGADIHAGDGGYSEGTQEQYDAFVKVRNKSLAQGRIKELALEAMTYVTHNPKANKLNAGDMFDEKFAELIVGECVRVVEGGHFLHDQAPTALFAKECSGAIKRHFGVEE